jgi:hypothetical protein
MAIGVQATGHGGLQQACQRCPHRQSQSKASIQVSPNETSCVAAPAAASIARPCVRAWVCRQPVSQSRGSDARAMHVHRTQAGSHEDGPGKADKKQEIEKSMNSSRFFHAFGSVFALSFLLLDFQFLLTFRVRLGVPAIVRLGRGWWVASLYVSLFGTELGKKDTHIPQRAGTLFRMRSGFYVEVSFLFQNNYIPERSCWRTSN